MFCNFESIQTVPTIQEQQQKNDKFLKEYKILKEIDDLQNKHPYLWNPNNTIESMQLKPCLATVPGSDRMSCYSAPLWWYPNDKYSADNFKEVYYGDYYNPIYNYLGNAQDMFWDFKSVRN